MRQIRERHTWMMASFQIDYLIRLPRSAVEPGVVLLWYLLLSILLSLKRQLQFRVEAALRLGW